MRTPTHSDKHANLAIGYVRVSTQEQAQEGVSLDVQRAGSGDLSVRGKELGSEPGKNHLKVCADADASLG